MFKKLIPSEVPGIVLSGGQTELEATENLNLINKHNNTNFIMSYSYDEPSTKCLKLVYGYKKYCSCLKDF